MTSFRRRSIRADKHARALTVLSVVQLALCGPWLYGAQDEQAPQIVVLNPYVPPPAVPENIPLLRMQLLKLENDDQLREDLGVDEIYNLRLRHIGALMLALARQGTWDPEVATAAEKLLAESAELVDFQPRDMLAGLLDMAQACRLLGRMDDAIKWQEKFAECCAAIRPGEGCGLRELAEYYELAGKWEQARETLLRLIKEPEVRPDAYFDLSVLLCEHEEFDAAKSALRQGVARFDQKVEEARTAFDGRRVFVDPQNTEGFDRAFWYPYCDPDVIPQDDAAQIQALKDRGFVEITTEAREYVVDEATKKQEEMRDFMTKLMPGIDKARDAAAEKKAGETVNDQGEPGE